MAMSMQFAANGRDVAAALNKILRISGRDIDNIILRATEQQLEIHANSVKQARRALIIVPATVEKSGYAQLERFKLDGICKNRGKINFTINKRGLTFTGEANYAGNNIAVLNYQKTNLLQLTNDRHIPAEVQSKLLTAIKACLISSVFGGKQLSLSLLSKNKQFYVIVADRFHSAVANFALNRSQRKRLRLAGFIKPIVLPIEYAEMLANQFNTVGLSIQVNSRNIIFASVDSKLELPALQTEHNYLEQALQLDTGLHKTQLTLLNGEQMVGVLDSLKIISKASVPLQLISQNGEKHLQLTYASANGKITDSMPLTYRTQEAVKLSLEPANFYSIASKLRGPIKISYSPDLICLRRNTEDGITIRYYSATLQERRTTKL